MRRRLATLFTVALLGSAVLLPLTAMPAMGADTAVVLAVESVDVGPEPMGPDAEENEFAPPAYEPNWTWRAGGKGLLALFLVVGAYLGLMYYLRVARPRQRSEQS